MIPTDLRHLFAKLFIAANFVYSAPSRSAHIREPACSTRGTISSQSRCFERGVARSIRCPIIFFGCFIENTIESFIFLFYF